MSVLVRNRDRNKQSRANKLLEHNLNTSFFDGLLLCLGLFPVQPKTFNLVSADDMEALQEDSNKIFGDARIAYNNLVNNIEKLKGYGR